MAALNLTAVRAGADVTPRLALPVDSRPRREHQDPYAVGCPACPARFADVQSCLAHQQAAHPLAGRRRASGPYQTAVAEPPRSRFSVTA